MMQLYTCIICNNQVACKPNTLKEERYCNHHTKEETENYLNNKNLKRGYKNGKSN